MNNKISSDIKNFIQRSKSRSVPLNLDSVSTTIGFCGVEPEKKSMDTSNAEVQNVSLDSISTASSSWWFATDYDLANESRLLNFNNASNEKLVNSSCYKLDYDDDEENTLKLGKVHICSLHRPDLGWSECNNNGFVNTICLTRDYKNCILNKWDVDCMFGLKDIINYRLELMQSYKLDVVFNGVIRRMVIELDKVKKKKTLEQTINDGDIGDDDDDWGVYEMFEKLINTGILIKKKNIMSQEDLNLLAFQQEDKEEPIRHRIREKEMNKKEEKFRKIKIRKVSRGNVKTDGKSARKERKAQERSDRKMEKIISENKETQRKLMVEIQKIREAQVEENKRFKSKGLTGKDAGHQQGNEGGVRLFEWRASKEN
ncbi:hypothetical protein FQR65_LT15447 [Abscondita terminalis]|nr:hypothetical protein FQR65_LT15447 [Abscondita terminalis]